MAKTSAQSYVSKSTGYIGCLAVLSLVVCIFGLEPSVAAQSDAGAWTLPVNISKSGGASQPVITATPDGQLHVLWWDAVMGERYARTTDATGLNWTEPITVTSMWGLRRSETDLTTRKVTVTTYPPYELQMLSDSSGVVRAFWRNSDNQLLAARLQGTEWSSPSPLADSIAGSDAVADAQGAVHLVYVRPTDDPNAPAGVYYQHTSATGWSKPVLVFASLYFRLIKPGQAHVSIGVNRGGQIVITWDDRELGQSVYVNSNDNGSIWTSPQRVNKSQVDKPLQSYAVSTPSGDFLLFWKDTGVSGCGVRWRRSSDGGANWSAPERIYSNFSYCPDRMRFPMASSDHPWLLGVLSAEGANVSGTLVTLVNWDGKTWSPPAEVSTDFRDNATDREVHLNGESIDLAVTEEVVGLAGIDAEGDLWVMRNAAPLAVLVPSAAPAWDAPESFFNQQRLSHAKDVPALVADPQGRVYAIWSEAATLTGPGTALYIVAQDGGRWSRPSQIFQSTASAASGATISPISNLAEQPVLAVDGHDRLHALWRGGASAQIFYSWTLASDALSPSTWAEPRPVPMRGQPGSWPDLVAEPRDDVLHVIYAVPYNEGRGIYYVRSTDGGTTWSQPTTVFDAVAAQWDSLDKPRLALDVETNVLHVVWLKTALVGNALGHAVVYARSTDSGQTWSAPVALAEGVTDWPRLAVAAAGQIYVVWNKVDTAAATTLSEVRGTFSIDSGQHWMTSQPVPGFQVTGPIGLTSDGAGGVHLVGAGQSPSGEATLVYSYWDGQAWSQTEASGLGREAAAGNGVSAVVLDQNRLEAVLREFVTSSDGGGFFRVLTAGRKIRTGLPVKPGPTLTPDPADADRAAYLAPDADGVATVEFN